MKPVYFLALAFLLNSHSAYSCDTSPDDVPTECELVELLKVTSKMICERSTGTVYHPNGRTAGSRGNTWYHDNGRTAGSNGNTWYHSNGRTAGSNGNTWYHSNGRTAGSHGNSWYYDNGRTAGSNGNTWYHKDGSVMGGFNSFSDIEILRMILE